MQSDNKLTWAYELMAEYLSDSVFILDEDRKPVYISPAFQDLFGIELDKLMKMDLFSLIHDGDRGHVEHRFHHMFQSGDSYRSEHRITDKHGRIRFCECRTTSITAAGKNYALVATRDVTDRKRMEQELEEKKNRYEKLQNSLSTFAKELSSIIKIAELEERLLKELKAVFPECQPSIAVMNLENKEAAGAEISVSRIALGRLERIGSKAVMKIGIRGSETYLLVLQAEAIHEEMDVTYLETLAHYVVMVFENVNVIGNLSRQLELALQGQEKPHWMMRLLFNLQEKQRLELSSELHDTVLQDQIDLYRRLEDLLEKCPLKRETKNELKAVEQGLLDSVHQIRVTCNELRPPLLQELGLERALENLFEQTQLSSTFKISFTYTRSDRQLLNEEQTIGIYRIVQELLNNAAKHSNASFLVFDLHRQEDRFILKYSDDGIGFEPDKLNPSFTSMGLSSIQQRAQSLSGSIQFYSEPDSGVQAVLQLPISVPTKQ